jgi:hypothetical protein
MKSMATVLVCALVLCGCANQPRGNVELADDQTMIVMSARVKDTCGGSLTQVLMTLEVLHGNNIAPRVIPILNPFLKDDFKDPPGRFLTLKLESGELRFTKLVRTGTKSSFQAERDLGFQMMLEPGKVYYLGELAANVTCYGYDVAVVDRRERDGKLFDQRMTTLKSSMFEVRLLGSK